MMQVNFTLAQNMHGKVIKKLKGFALKKYTSVDIDYPDDWKFAEFLYKNKFSK